MKVKDFHENNPEKLDLISPDKSLDEVYKSMVKDRATRVVYVVNDDKKLLGIIEIGILINLYGAKYATGPIDILTRFSKLLANTAKDIMGSPISVKMEDHFKKAISLMLETQTYDIPVVDNKKRVIGSVNCFELLRVLKEGTNSN